MRRLPIALASAAVVSLGLTACGSSSDQASSASPAAAGSLAAIKKSGEITIATEGTYKPFSYHKGGAGELTGYDVDVAKAVAKKLGVKPVFKETQFDGIFAGLKAGRFDLIANEISINPAREKAYDMSDPYTYSPGVVIVRSDNKDIKSLKDLKGKTSAQSLTSNFYKLAKGAGANVEAVEGWAQSVDLLEQGRVDATVNDQLTYLDYKKQKPDAKIKSVGQAGDVSRNAFAAKKGSEKLVTQINSALEALQQDGTLAKYGEKYFGRNVSTPPKS